MSSNIEEFENKSGEPIIDDRILNTPPKDPTDLRKTIPDNTVENYLDINKPKKVNPQGGVVLDLDGKQLQLDSGELGTEKKSEMLSNIFGDAAGSDDEGNPGGAIFVFIVIIVGLFVFIYMSLKRTEYIMKLEQEVQKLKDK